MTWVKSSYSNGDGGGCVEWAPSATTTGAVPVRDSKEPTGPVLSFTSHGWTTFVTAVKRDNFTA
ncbi:DUF397 domain-containing protein [Streptomyces sp. JJ66]|uniref:DUF397 domain-containing protein n=1 Tax=Streptomyces sp. JJ66 TaxID=2803843 RepID=UPI0035AF7804